MLWIVQSRNASIFITLEQPIIWVLKQFKKTFIQKKQTFGVFKFVDELLLIFYVISQIIIGIGITFYEMLFGVVPYDANSDKVINKNLI